MSDECTCRWTAYHGETYLEWTKCKDALRLSIDSSSYGPFAQHIAAAVRRLDVEQRAKGVPSDDEIEQAWQSWASTFRGSVLDWVIFMAGAKWGHSRGGPAPALGTCEEEYRGWFDTTGRYVYAGLSPREAWDGCWNLHHPPEPAPDPCDAAWQAYRNQVLRSGDIPSTNAEAAFRAGWERNAAS